MTAENASMSDLVGALHSLGQFFDDHLDDASSPAIGRGPRAPASETPSERRVRAIVGVSSVLSVVRDMLTLLARPPAICLVACVRTSISAQRRTPSPHSIRLDRVKSGIDDLDGDTSREPEAAPRFNSINSMSRPTQANSVLANLWDLPDRRQNPTTPHNMATPFKRWFSHSTPASRRERHLKPSVSSISESRTMTGRRRCSA